MTYHEIPYSDPKGTSVDMHRSKEIYGDGKSELRSERFGGAQSKQEPRVSASAGFWVS
jgi:hypothetical protein